MGNEERIRVDREFYVNEATIDLLRFRIESEVKRNFFRWIGMPIGGAGVVAILYMLFVQIPNILTSQIENAIGGKVERVAQEYVNDPKTGQQLIQAKAADALAQYFKSPEWIKALNRAVQPAKDKLAFVISGPLKEKLVGEIIDKGRIPVATVGETGTRPEMVEKGSINSLHQFLNSSTARELKRKRANIAMTTSIRQGTRYVDRMILLYIQGLSAVFEKHFKHFLILDNDGSFLALLSPEQMKVALVEHGEQMMNLLNASPDQLSPEGARQILAKWFGRGSIASVRLEWSVDEALRAPPWSQPELLDEELAVIDGNRKFVGTTSRGQLIRGALG